MKERKWWHFRKYIKGGHTHIIFDEDIHDKNNPLYYSLQINSHGKSGNSKNIKLKGKYGDNASKDSYLQKKLYKKPKKLYKKKLSYKLEDKDYEVIKKIANKKRS